MSIGKFVTHFAPLVFLLPSCGGPSIPAVETVAFAKGVVEMSDDATALISGSPDLLTQRGLYAMDAATYREHVEDWRVMKETALRMLGTLNAPLPPVPAQVFPVPMPDDGDALDEDEDIQ